VWHLRRGRIEEFSELLIDIYRYLRPAVTIIDGVVAMEGRGPIWGSDRRLGWLVGGTEAIACERVCCELVDFDAGELPILRAAERMGFGCHERGEIEVVGDDYSERICRDLERAELVPVGFSFLHVVKSVCKQIVLLAKGR